MDNESNYGQREVCSIVARGWWKIYHPLSNVNENCLKIDRQNGHSRTLVELGSFFHILALETLVQIQPTQSKLCVGYFKKSSGITGPSSVSGGFEPENLLITNMGSPERPLPYLTKWNLDEMKLNYKLCIMVMYGKVDDVVLVSMTVKVTIELIISTVYVDCLLHQWYI